MKQIRAQPLPGPIPARAGQPPSRPELSIGIRAYPRTSGATFGISKRAYPTEGLSPHERGNLFAKSAQTLSPGPIPARAGQPRGCPLVLVLRGAYPRTSGATLHVGSLRVVMQGLSPHERGNRRLLHRAILEQGPIPARAGQPRVFSTPSSPDRAYPRTSGATFQMSLGLSRIQGLSPHERGNPAAARFAIACVGPIPARAGQPDNLSMASGPMGAYPRTSGATLRAPSNIRYAWGLSPHERGNLVVVHWPAVQLGPIPARAGQPASGNSSTRPERAYPRTSGATIANSFAPDMSAGLSPHERGNR